MDHPHFAFLSQLWRVCLKNVLCYDSALKNVDIAKSLEILPMKNHTSVSLEKSFVQQLDTIRGSTPRSVVLQSLIERFLSSMIRNQEADRDHQ